MVSRSETSAVQRRLVARILAGLDRRFHGRGIELNASGPWELLVATILSAQCTDERVNRVMPGLLAVYRTPADFAAADRAVLERLIKSDRKSTRLNSSHIQKSRMPSSA